MRAAIGMTLVTVCLGCGDAGTTGALVTADVSATADGTCLDCDATVTPEVATAADTTTVAPDVSPPFDGDTSPTDTATPPACTVDGAALAAKNLASLQRFGLARSGAIVRGTFSGVITLYNEPHGTLTLTEVPFGWSFLAGQTVQVPLPKGVTPQNGEPWVLGLSQAYPTKVATNLVWSPVHAAMPVASIPEGAAVGYRALKDASVAVVRITKQDKYRTRFEVVETLAGTLPAAFEDNWYAEWGLPYPKPSTETTWLATVTGVSTIVRTGDILGSVVDFRPDTPEQRATITAALKASTSPFGGKTIASVKAAREAMYDAYRFRKAPMVVESVVSGVGEECCTGAGGTFVSNHVTAVLFGQPPADFVVGGHAHYSKDQCKDAILYALESATAPSADVLAALGCEKPSTVGLDTSHTKDSARISARRGATEPNRAQVKAWLATRLPELDVRPVDAPLNPKASEGQPGPWSETPDAAEAFAMATSAILLTIEAVTTDPVTQAKTVRFSTTWSLYEYDHLVKSEAVVTFTCGDPRWLEPKSRWIAPLVLLDAQYTGPGAPPDLSRAFFLPDVLVPESAMTMQLANDLAQVFN